MFSASSLLVAPWETPGDKDLGSCRPHERPDSSSHTSAGLAQLSALDCLGFDLAMAMRTCTHPESSKEHACTATLTHLENGNSQLFKVESFLK